MSKHWNHWPLLALLPISAASGSATTADFRICATLAAGRLETCLRPAGAYEAPQCWSEARRIHAQCVSDVQESFSEQEGKIRQIEGESHKRLNPHLGMDDNPKDQPGSDPPSN